MILEATLQSTVVMLSLFLAVIVSNTLVVIVWLSPGSRTSISILLSIIAIYDALTITCSATHSLLDYITWNILWNTGCYFVKVGMECAYYFHTLSIISTTFLAIQRCVVCAFPFSGPKLCGLTSVKIFSVVSFFAVWIPGSVNLLFYKINLEEIPYEDNTTDWECIIYNVLDNDTMYDVWNTYFILRLIGLCILPSVVIIFCMIVILITINRTTNTIGQSSNQRNTTRTNLMLVLIMLVFVIGEFPTTLNIFYATFLEDESPWIVSADGVWFCNISVIVSYLVNIWVYIAMSKQFRDSLFQLFSCCKHKQQGSESIGSNIITVFNK